MSMVIFYKWKFKYGGMDLFMMIWFKELEIENVCLKCMYVDEWLN